ncbi:MAG: DUF2079 domain-containing protein [bacterium]|nr:DUF2079 domain-containing protein [bacterium]
MTKRLISRIYTHSPYIITLLITALYILLSLLRHRSFHTYAYDLGIYDQTVWLYSRFIYPFVTIEYKFALLNHFSPSLALLAPIYWVWSDPQALLVTQAILIGASSIPFIKLSKKLLLPTYLISTLTLIYVAFYGYQYSVNYDVHSLVFGTTLIPWFILALENKKTKSAIMLYLIIICMKESFPVMMFSIGVVYFLRKQKKLGLILIITSLLYLAILMKALIPWMQSLSNEIYRFSPSNQSSLISYITNIANTPQKQQVWTVSILWFALIPFLAPSITIAAFGDVAFYFIFGNNHPETHNLFYHYRSSLAPLLIWSTIYGCINVKKFLKISYQIQSIILLFTFTFLQLSLQLPLNSLLQSKWYENPQYIQDNNAIIKKVPKNAAITAQNSLVPRLSQRKEIHVLWPVWNNNGYVQFPICSSSLKEITYGIRNPNYEIEKNNCPESQKIQTPCNNEWCFWLRFHSKTQYIITDTHQNQNAVTLLMENESKLKEGLSNLAKLNIITKQESQGETTLWKVN